MKGAFSFLGWRVAASVSVGAVMLALMLEMSRRRVSNSNGVWGLGWLVAGKDRVVAERRFDAVWAAQQSSSYDQEPLVFRDAVGGKILGKWGYSRALLGKEKEISFVSSVRRISSKDVPHTFCHTYENAAMEQFYCQRNDRQRAFCSCPKTKLRAIPDDILTSADARISFAKIAPSDEFPGAKRAMRELRYALFGKNGGRNADAENNDIWIGTRGWQTHTHFDYQLNFYVQLRGSKHFVLAAPTRRMLNATKLYPDQSPRKRQTRDILKVSHPTAVEVILNPGDVLLIPPAYLHTATAVPNENGFSISAALCMQSALERVFERVSRMALPFSLEWTLEETAVGVAMFIKRFAHRVDTRCFLRAAYDIRFSFLPLLRGDAAASNMLHAAFKTLNGMEETEMYKNVTSRANEIFDEMAAASSTQWALELIITNYLEKVVTYMLGGDRTAVFFRVAAEHGNCP